MSDANWKNDNLQFMRLLAEIHASKLTTEQYMDLSESMDLPYGKIDELLQRATDAFERATNNELYNETWAEEERRCGSCGLQRPAGADELGKCICNPARVEVQQSARPAVSLDWVLNTLAGMRFHEAGQAHDYIKRAYKAGLQEMLEDERSE